MKKIYTILLATLYLVPAIGIMINVHHCGGELASVSLVQSFQRTCACSNEDALPGCCENTVVRMHIGDAQQKSPVLTTGQRQVFLLHPAVLPPATQVLLPSLYVHRGSGNGLHSGTRTQQQPLYLRHKVFRT